MNDLSDQLAEALEAKGAAFVDVYRDQFGDYQVAYYDSPDANAPSSRTLITAGRALAIIDGADQ